MKVYNFRIYLILSILLLASIACSTFTGIVNPPTATHLPTLTNTAMLLSATIVQPTDTATPSPPTQTPTRTTTTTPFHTSTPDDAEISQWAEWASASSEYSPTGWSADAALGEPDTDITDSACSDEPSAWASADSDTMEWLELRYETPVIPLEVRIIQTYGPDQVTRVEVIDLEDNYFTIYESDPIELDSNVCPYELTISVTDVDALVNGIRITIDQTEIEDWNEIDAVQLNGLPRDNTPGGDDGIPSEGEIPGIPAADKAPVGGFYFRVFSTELNETIIRSDVENRSIDEEIIVDLTSHDGIYALSLFFTPEFDTEFVVMDAYEQISDVEAPSAFLVIDSRLYLLEFGSYEIEDFDENTISGNFYMAMQAEDDPEEYVSVEGAFNSIPVRIP